MTRSAINEKSSRGKKIRATLPTHSRRLIDDALPAGLPSGLHPDLRGMFLLEHYGGSDAMALVEETLAFEAEHGGLGIGPDHLGFLEDYYRLGQYLSKLDVKTVIVDVGCSTGLQQVFFSQFAGYIGIDQHVPACARALYPNVEFIEGNFAELVASGEFKIESHMFGIANMSLLYQAGNEASVAAFKRFDRLLIA